MGWVTSMNIEQLYERGIIWNSAPEAIEALMGIEPEIEEEVKNLTKFSNTQIYVLIGSLTRMGAYRHAPTDGRGCHLGSGSAFEDPLRSNDLKGLLTELLAWRIQCSDLFYDEQTGNILYDGVKLQEPKNTTSEVPV